jgi:tetrapyrrole methylase family protein/MazG family protein
MIIEEIGDVMLQTAFYVIFGEECGRYTFYDVLSGICSKLISRHTHVFGTDKASDALSALDTWNKNKAVEKGYASGTEYLKSVPKNFPAVMRAQKVGSRAGKQGFDFNDYTEVISKVYEEVEEIKLAVKSGSSEDIKKECGDLLFSVVNLVRKLDVDGETALNISTEKFINRFSRLEKAVEEKGLKMKDLTQLELDKIYNEHKKTEKF